LEQKPKKRQFRTRQQDKLVMWHGICHWWLRRI